MIVTTESPAHWQCVSIETNHWWRLRARAAPGSARPHSKRNARFTCRLPPRAVTPREPRAGDTNTLALCVSAPLNLAETRR